MFNELMYKIHLGVYCEAPGKKNKKISQDLKVREEEIISMNLIRF